MINDDCFVKLGLIYRQQEMRKVKLNVKHMQNVLEKQEDQLKVSH